MIDEATLVTALEWAQEKSGRRGDGWIFFGVLVEAAREREQLRGELALAKEAFAEASIGLNDAVEEAQRERDEARAESELRNRMYREATDALASSLRKLKAQENPQ